MVDLVATLLSLFGSLTLGSPDFNARQRWSHFFRATPVVAAAVCPLLRDHPDPEVAYRATRADPDLARVYYDFLAYDALSRPQPLTWEETLWWAESECGTALDRVARYAWCEPAFDHRWALVTVVEGGLPNTLVVPYFQSPHGLIRAWPLVRLRYWARTHLP